MSNITISHPEVVTGNTDVICSTSIRHVVTVRNAALQQTETLIRQLAEISVRIFMKGDHSITSIEIG